MPRSSALLLAFAAMLAGLATGCRSRSRGARGHAPPSVRVGEAVDARASAFARTIDEKLGSACPATMRFVTLPPVARDAAAVIAQRCLAGAPPSLFSRGLVELLAIEASGDEAEATTLRTLAHGLFAEGLEADTARGDRAETADAVPQPTRSDAGARAVAFAVVAHLAARPGVGEKGVLRLARALAQVSLDVALERPPLRTDFDTLFAVARADALEWPLPRGPQVIGLELRDQAGARVIVVGLDRPAREEPREASICGVPTLGTFVDEAHDALRFLAPECPALDGEPIYVVEIGGTATSPRGLDGAIVAHTYGRALPASP